MRPGGTTADCVARARYAVSRSSIRILQETPSTARWWTARSRRPGASPRSKCTAASSGPAWRFESRPDRRRRCLDPFPMRIRRDVCQIDQRQIGRAGGGVGQRQVRILSRRAEAECVVPMEHLAERSPQDARVEARGHLEDERLVPVVRIREALFEEPALDRGQRERPSCWLVLGLRRGPPRCRRAPRAARWSGFAARSRGVNAQARLAAARDDLDAQDRVAAELEEVVVDADASSAEDRGPDPGERPLDRRCAARRTASGARVARTRAPAAPCGRPCRSAVSGSASRTTKCAGTMYSGSFVRRWAFSSSAERSGSAVATTYATSRLSAAPSSRDHDRRSLHARGAAPSTASISPSSMRKPRIFTWSSIRPRYSRSPFGQAPREVAGAVQRRAGVGGERIGDESLGGQLGPVEVAARHSCAADVHLARRRPSARARHARRSSIRCAGPGSARRSRCPRRRRGRPREIGRYVTCTVVSVIPYMLTSWGRRRRTARTTAAGSGARAPRRRRSRSAARGRRPARLRRPATS